jgi:hypothetical protein
VGTDLTWTISGERDGNTFKAVYKGKPDGNEIKGSVDFDFAGNSGTIDFSGQRTPPDKQASKNDEKKAGKKDAKKPADGKSGAREKKPLRPVAQLKNSRETLVIYAAPGVAPVFSLLAADGRTLAEKLSTDQLKRRYPQFYELYRRGYVDVWAETVISR